MGNTGLSRGDHLHYSIIKEGFKPDPKTPTGGPIGIELKKYNTLDPGRHDFDPPHLNETLRAQQMMFGPKALASRERMTARITAAPSVSKTRTLGNWDGPFRRRCGDCLGSSWSMPAATRSTAARNLPRQCSTQACPRCGSCSQARLRPTSLMHPSTSVSSLRFPSAGCHPGCHPGREPGAMVSSKQGEANERSARRYLRCNPFPPLSNIPAKMIQHRMITGSSQKKVRT